MIFDDAEQAVLDVVERCPAEPGGVFRRAMLVSTARAHSSFGERRLRQATSTLSEKGLLLPLKDGRLQVTGLGRRVLAERTSRG